MEYETFNKVIAQEILSVIRNSFYLDKALAENETAQNHPDICEFVVNNISYIHEHFIRESDYEKYFALKQAIEQRAATAQGPQYGDSLHIYARNGREYPNAMITNTVDLSMHGNACTQPMIPFVSIDKDGNVHFSVSGGYFSQWHEGAELKSAGKKQRFFKIWGSGGPCGNGALTVAANVNHWEVSSEKFY